MGNKHEAGVLKAEAEGNFTATIATLEAIDRDGDVIAPGAVASGKRIPISGWNHASWGGELPVGVGETFEQDGTLKVRGHFFTDTKIGDETYKTVRNLGELAEWSWGFDVLQSQPDTVDGKRVNRIERAEIFEASPVLLGAGVDTGTDAIKRHERELEKTAEGGEALFLARAMKRRAKAREEWERAAYYHVPANPPSMHFADIAARTVRHVCKGLGQHEPAIQWFRAETPEEREKRLKHGAPYSDYLASEDLLDGAAQKRRGILWLSAELGAHELVKVAAHEARHFWQEGFDTGLAEYDAVKYAEHFVKTRV